MKTALVIFFKVIILVLFFVVALAAWEFLHYQSQGLDLLQPAQWLEFPGAKGVFNGIHFTPSSTVIVHQDGSKGQINPPVNITGQRPLVKGDFSLTARLSQVDKQAHVRFYGAPPLIYDQWRYETPSVDIEVDASTNTITVRIWDGSSSYSMDERTYPVFLASPITISLEHKNDSITMLANDRVLGDIPDHSIFSSGEIWAGLDTTGSFVLNSLRALALKGGSVALAPPLLLVAPQKDSQSLAGLAQVNSKKLKIGAAVSLNQLLTDKQYRDLALGQFSMWTLENSMKPQFIHPTPDVYHFAEADKLVDTALKNNIMVHGHALVYAKANPDWMTKTPKENLQKIMAEHVQQVASHFKGKVAEWDVVNEPFSKKNALYKDGGSGLDENSWFEVMGENYIDLAFKTAHEADADAKLYLNDFGLENDGQHWDAMLGLVKRLKQRGVPIDGVGFEAHIYSDGDYIHPDQLKKHMEALAQLGLLARISEIDVTQDDAKEQINQYVTALDICLRAPNCTSYTTWGITDKYGSTTRSDRYPLVYGTSLVWDKNMKPKPVLEALQKRLQ